MSELFLCSEPAREMGGGGEIGEKSLYKHPRRKRETCWNNTSYWVNSQVLSIEQHSLVIKTFVWQGESSTYVQISAVPLSP